jgi:hypothetical protein
MLPGITEYGELKTGQRSEGSYYAFASFLQKDEWIRRSSAIEAKGARSWRKALWKADRFRLRMGGMGG